MNNHERHPAAHQDRITSGEIFYQVYVKCSLKPVKLEPCIKCYADKGFNHYFNLFNQTVSFVNDVLQPEFDNPCTLSNNEN